jgi:hypothetical protein
MPSNLPIDLNQTEQNQMTIIATQQRDSLIPRNDYVQTADEYSSTNPDALADGDSMGRGTGIFLDVYNNTAGTREDVTERISEIRINKYNSNRTYPNF